MGGPMVLLRASVQGVEEYSFWILVEQRARGTE